MKLLWPCMWLISAFTMNQNSIVLMCMNRCLAVALMIIDLDFHCVESFSWHRRKGVAIKFTYIGANVCIYSILWSHEYSWNGFRYYQRHQVICELSFLTTPCAQKQYRKTKWKQIRFAWQILYGLFIHVNLSFSFHVIRNPWKSNDI